MKKILILSILLLGLNGCDAKPEGPFGFQWGQSVQDVKTLDLKNFQLKEDNGYIDFVSIDSAPEPAPYNGHYFLSFMRPVGLTGVDFSKQVDKDSWEFEEGKVIYDEISKKLQEKYGEPEVHETIKDSGNQFYICLNKKDCGKWERIFRKDGVEVKLQVAPTFGTLMDGVSKAFVKVDYEYLTDGMKKKIANENLKKESSNNF